MARAKLAVDLDKLRKVVEEVEKDGPLPNIAVLCKIISQRMGNISPQVVRLRLTSENVVVKTMKGRRGRPHNTTGFSNPYKEELGKRHIAAIRRTIPLATRKDDVGFKKAMKSIYRLEDGEDYSKQLKAAITLKCLDCTNNEVAEIRECNCIDCALWLQRPFR
jgi:hypothetical protein